MRTLSLSRLLVIALLIIVAFQVLYPMGMIFYGSVRDTPPGYAGNFSLAGYVEVFTNRETYELLLTTFWLAVVRTVLTVVGAVFLAWAVSRTNVPFRRHLEWLIVLIFFLPLLPRILAWIVMLSPRTGLINQFLRLFLPLGDQGLNIFSYGGVIFVSVLGWIPILFILLVPAFKAMDANLEESSRMSGASVVGTIWRINVPMMTPALLAASTLGFVRMMESFEVEAMLGIPANIYVLTTKIYHYVARTEPPLYPPAMALATALLMMAFLLVAGQWRILGQREYVTVTGKGYRAQVLDLGRSKWLVFFGVVAFIFVDLALPMGVLIWSSFMKFAGVFMPDMYTLSHWGKAFASPELLKAVWNSVIMGGASATIGMILCSFIAYIVVRTGFQERRPLDLIVWVPWAIPAIVLALGFLWAYIFLPLPFGLTIYGTMALLVLALICKGFPLGTRTMTSTIVQLSRELEESSQIHGASWPQTFTRIVLPLVLPGFLAGWILLFSYAVKDLDTVLLLHSPETTLITTTIFRLSSAGQIEAAIILGMVQATVLAIAYFVSTAIARWLSPGKPV
ncbi:MAG: iron ABC transporter permease [Chloroflexi bacterium]|nr:iron ABC transporter permease [Chloroflexota bacterium]